MLYFATIAHEAEIMSGTEGLGSRDVAAGEKASEGSMEPRVVAVVVTYNRRELLKRCIDAISRQTIRPGRVLIVDNDSQDGTAEMIMEDYGDWVDVVRMLKNTGGAGGFHRGIAVAVNRYGAEFLWLMDDDGVPNTDQLEMLLAGCDRLGLEVANALVVCDEDADVLSFGLVSPEGTIATVQEAVAFAMDGDGVIWNEINNFNGTLIKSGVFERMAPIRREMFVWGDEIDFLRRAIRANTRVGTYVRAVHWHPSSRKQCKRFGPVTITIPPLWARYIVARNMGYLYRNTDGFLFAFLRGLIYTVFFMRAADLRVALKIALYWADGMADTYRLSPSRKHLGELSEHYELFPSSRG